jgi:LuxR family maltose regulon positive regulatory protein
MSTAIEPINKISRPRLTGVFKRERIFRLLDDARRHSLIWISAPAGAGKTTLVASYLEFFQLPCLWYQIDPRDNDPATFFYYLSLAVKRASPRKRKPIPLLTPEFMPGINSFALRYFEAVYQRLPKPVLLVLDNYQQINPVTITHELISNGLSILPEGITGIVISREHPPATFSRMMANREAVQIGWNRLRLTLEETAGIVRLQMEKSISETIIQQLHTTADGWTAGLMLMLAHSELEDIDWQSFRDFTPQEILDYFAKEVFENETSEIQDFLLRVSFLPHMTASMAERLSGNPRAGQILSKLNRNNRFTERRIGQRVLYQLHPLFREFLLSRAKLKYAEDELTDWRFKAAMLLAEEGDPESAAELLQDARAWDALTALILKHAQIMIRQGRNHPLLQWLQSLPETMVVDMPWLQFWMGVALTPFDPEAGRGSLEKAFEAFRSPKDPVGLYLSWSFIIRAIFLKMADISPFDHWIQVLEELMEKYRQFPSIEIEGQVAAAMLLALGHRQMDYPNIESWVDRALRLLSSPLDPNTKVSIVNNTVHYFLLTGKYGKAAQIIDLLRPFSSGPRMDSKDTIAVVAHSAISTFYYCYVGMHAKCIDIMNNGLETAKKTGFIILNNIIAGHGIWSALINEDYATAGTLFEKNAASIDNAGLLDQGLIDLVKSLESLGTGNLSQAAAYAASALNASLEVGSQFSTIFCHLLNARVLYESGEQQTANAHLNKAIQLSQLTRTKHFVFHALMLKARFALNQDHAKAGLKVLREALALGKEIGLYHNMIESRSNVARLCAMALEHGIEVNYVTTYIRKRNLTPDTPPITIENWPWPIKVFTLGHFSIFKDGVPIRFSTKAQKKPLELMKVLIALGGRGVSKAYLSDALWPDAEGDKADRTLTTTIHRLRRLLGDDRAVEVQSGKLELNPFCCWVDCWAFERLLSTSEDASKLKDMDAELSLTEKALAVYKGAFLAGEMLESWAVSPREHLRSSFLRAVNRIGSLLASIGQWEKAADYYQRSLDVDDLSEETYQRLMQCLQQLGRKTEALSVYERCRKTLNAAFDLPPSSKTQAIRRSLLKGCL